MNKKIYLPLILCAIAVLVVWKIYGQQTKPAAAKQTWEYKACSLYRNIDSKGWIERYEDGVSMGAPFSMGQRMNELGAQGWELISVTAISSSFHDGFENSNYENSTQGSTPSYAGYTNSLNYYFKRLK